MTPFIFAAALALTGPIQGPLDDAAKPPIIKILPSRPLGSFSPIGQTQACARELSKTLGPDGLPLKKLGDLPRALEEHAVLRMVRGCPVLEVVYEGQVYYFQGPVGGMEYDLHGSRLSRPSY